MDFNHTLLGFTFGTITEYVNYAGVLHLSGPIKRFHCISTVCSSMYMFVALYVALYIMIGLAMYICLDIT